MLRGQRVRHQVPGYLTWCSNPCPIVSLEGAAVTPPNALRRRSARIEGMTSHVIHENR